MKESLKQIKDGDERIRQWREEWGSLSDGSGYEYWIEEKLLSAEEAIERLERSIEKRKKMFRDEQQRLFDYNRLLSAEEKENQQLRAALQAVRDWYHRDGSVGGCDQMIHEHVVPFTKEPDSE